MSRNESQIRKTIVKTAIFNLTTPVYTRAVDREACVNECFMIAISDPEMREYMATRTDRQVARMGGDVKRAIDRYFNRRIVREVYVSHNDLGHTGHKVCFERKPRGGGETTARWYGVDREITASSIKRLNRAMLSIQTSARIEGIADAEWVVSTGIFKQGMYIRMWR